MRKDLSKLTLLHWCPNHRQAFMTYPDLHDLPCQSCMLQPHGERAVPATCSIHDQLPQAMSFQHRLLNEAKFLYWRHNFSS